MNQWPYQLRVFSLATVLETVREPEWQLFRLSLKGLPTEYKLDRLHAYREEGITRLESPELQLRREIRVTNYLNALKRAGQLHPITLRVLK